VNHTCDNFTFYDLFEFEQTDIRRPENPVLRALHQAGHLELMQAGNTAYTQLFAAKLELSSEVKAKEYRDTLYFF